MNNKRIGLLLAVIAVFVIGLGAYTMTSGQDEVVEAIPPDTTPEPPKEVITPPPPPEGRSVIVDAIGPSTKGALINIVGKDIQLPPDAYIAHNLIGVSCVIGSGTPCPEAPLYVIARGNSTISVSRVSGALYNETIGEGDKEPFEFLKEALR